ncbi:prolyl aminopeptidase [Caulobacter sp. D4A]|uniref:prolyl aminopeptidase n=1 Tax=unclassified Caulobacter TaxID=2648921 RepID=UPI000D72F36B|nr:MULTISPECIES: prolyl aminopeptidase [unclassified Caulobacter]PXA88701.1 prolyl aminopeptidase [Caulobacter sp. D4A]PXA89065.1 prolyl aminopeptidase [Caulobacter sp. D5]
MNFSTLRTTSKVTTEWKYAQPTASKSGLLQVDTAPDHKLYWEEYGNPDGEPVMFLHGGPGGACAPPMARFFDPDRYRVILFDQRGCGKSQPTVASAGPQIALTHNTTDHLVDDINRLRDALGITGRMHVFGGSRGSTLALTYAIRHADKVASLILRGIFLGATEDLLYMYQGNAAAFTQTPYALTEPGAYIAYPDEWKAFVEVIAPEDRGDIMGAYKAIFDMVPATEAERRRQLEAAVAWSVWEGTISNMIPDNADAGKFGEADFALCFAQIEAHFFANGLFLEPDYIVRNAGALKGLDIHIVHGRFDQVCPLSQASRLVAALEEVGAPPASYVKTDAGHSAMEGQTVLALTAIMDGLPRI